MAEIPKILHYCWFGNKPLPKLAEDCIASWKQFCPDYEIKLWNESNSITYFNIFCKQAYRDNRFAFVSDCIRVKVLNDFGGIYLDTDMMLVKPLDGLRNYHFFSAYEVSGRVAYGIFGGIAGHRFFKLMEDYYEHAYFNRYSLPVITHTFKESINKGRLKSDEKLFEPDFAYPMPFERREEDYHFFITPNTFAVHLWDHSWGSKRKETAWTLVKDIINVINDYLFHDYPYAYLKRYVRGFGRKLWHRIIGKKK